MAVEKKRKQERQKGVREGSREGGREGTEDNTKGIKTKGYENNYNVIWKTMLHICVVIT